CERRCGPARGSARNHAGQAYAGLARGAGSTSRGVETWGDRGATSRGLVKLLHVKLPLAADGVDDEVVRARTHPEARVGAADVSVRGDLQARSAARGVDEHLERGTRLVRRAQAVDAPVLGHGDFGPLER